MFLKDRDMHLGVFAVYNASVPQRVPWIRLHHFQLSYLRNGPGQEEH